MEPPTQNHLSLSECQSSQGDRSSFFGRPILHESSESSILVQYSTVQLYMEVVGQKRRLRGRFPPPHPGPPPRACGSRCGKLVSHTPSLNYDRTSSCSLRLNSEVLKTRMELLLVILGGKEGAKQSHDCMIYLTTRSPASHSSYSQTQPCSAWLAPNQCLSGRPWCRCRGWRQLLLDGKHVGDKMHRGQTANRDGTSCGPEHTCIVDGWTAPSPVAPTLPPLPRGPGGHAENDPLTPRGSMRLGMQSFEVRPPESSHLPIHNPVC